MDHDRSTLFQHIIITFGGVCVAVCIEPKMSMPRDIQPNGTKVDHIRHTYGRCVKLGIGSLEWWKSWEWLVTLYYTLLFIYLSKVGNFASLHKWVYDD